MVSGAGAMAVVMSCIRTVVISLHWDGAKASSLLSGGRPLLSLDHLHHDLRDYRSQHHEQQAIDTRACLGRLTFQRVQPLGDDRATRVRRHRPDGRFGFRSAAPERPYEASEFLAQRLARRWNLGHITPPDL